MVSLKRKGKYMKKKLKSNLRKYLIKSEMNDIKNFTLDTNMLEYTVNIKDNTEGSLYEQIEKKVSELLSVKKNVLELKNDCNNDSITDCNNDSITDSIIDCNINDNDCNINDNDSNNPPIDSETEISRDILNKNILVINNRMIINKSKEIRLDMLNTNNNYEIIKNNVSIQFIDDICDINNSSDDKINENENGNKCVDITNLNYQTNNWKSKDGLVEEIDYEKNTNYLEIIRNEHVDMPSLGCNKYSEYLNREIDKSIINDLKKISNLSLAHSREIIDKNSREIIDRNSREIIDKNSREIIDRNSREIIDKNSREIIDRNSREIINRNSREIINKNSREIIDRNSYKYNNDNIERKLNVEFVEDNNNLNERDVNNLLLNQRFQNSELQLNNLMCSITDSIKEIKKTNILKKMADNSRSKILPGILHFVLFSLDKFEGISEKDNKETISVKIKINKNNFQTPIFEKKNRDTIKYYTKTKIETTDPVKVNLLLQRHRKPTFLNSKSVEKLGICEFEIQDLLAYSNKFIKLESKWEAKKGIFRNKRKEVGKFTAYLSYIADKEIGTTDLLPPADVRTLNKWLVYKKNSNKLLFAGYVEVNCIEMYIEWYGFSIRLYDIYKNLQSSLNILDAKIIGIYYGVSFEIKGRVTKLKFDSEEKVNICNKALNFLFGKI